MKKILACALCLFMAAALPSCGGESTEDPQETQQQQSVQLEFPEEVDGYSQHGSLQSDETSAQITYYGGSGSMTVRKTIGADSSWSELGGFDLIDTVEINGVNVDMRGADDIVYAAVWTDGDYNYSILSGAGETLEFMTALVGKVE